LVIRADQHAERMASPGPSRKSRRTIILIGAKQRRRVTDPHWWRKRTAEAKMKRILALSGPAQARLLEASIDGCTEAIMMSYGFKTELLVELVDAGLATATIEPMVVGGRRVKVVRMRITVAGRQALSKLRWP
jgi:hypothetical protein